MDVFSNLMVIGECLLDARRTNAFIKAIQKTVRSHDIVLDVGTGSGILAMTAARAGAKHVYALDIAHDIVAFAKKNIKTNELQRSITVQEVDAKNFYSKGPADVVTMELMDTWLVGEQQGVVMNNLHANGTVLPQTRLIPYRYLCALTLVSYDFSFYGNSMPFVIQARNFGVLQRVRSKLSSRSIVNDIDFRRIVLTDVDLSPSINMTKSGVCNALLLESKTLLAPGIEIWGTTDMNMPVIVPLEERRVRKGQHLKLHIEYQMGEGFETFEAGWV